MAASDDTPVTERLENEQEEREIENSEFTGSECNETSDWMDSNDTITASDITKCSAQCCLNYEKASQPLDKTMLASLTSKGRKFLPQWYKQFPWLNICTTKRAVYCLYCCFSCHHNLNQFTRREEKVFTEVGFQNWKKAIEKFKSHERSTAHRDAKLAWIAQSTQNIDVHLNSQLEKLKMVRREGLIAQLRGIKYLARQGIAIRGHDNTEGNLEQLMRVWSCCEGDEGFISKWIKDNKYTSHQAVNDQIKILGQTLLRNLLLKMKEGDGPHWFSIIADEATDIINSEQLNVSIRWVNDTYHINEDSIGLCRVPNTSANTLYTIIKDLLICCSLPLSLCRGQAYDGAATMLGKKAGVATRFLKDNAAAIPIHCCAHSLNLCLQDAGRKFPTLRDALESVREISNLIRYSPKRSHLFSTKLLQEEYSTSVHLKSLCTTRWTA